MSRRAIVGAVLIAGAASVLSFRPIYEPDLWWHLAHGRENAAGRLVRTNVFSFLYPDYRQHYTSWLFDTTAYAVVRAFGLTGVQVLQALLLALTFVLVYRSCRLRAPPWTAAAILIVGFFVLEPRAIPRPHLASFAGLAACVLAVERAAVRRSAAPLWAAAAVIALWSNFHVECAFGAAYVAIVACLELIKPTALDRREALRASGIAAVCVVATMANPYGWGLLAYLYENRLVPQILNIAELQPPPPVQYRAFYVYLAAAAALVIWRWRRVRPRHWELAAVVLFAALGLRYLRLTPLALLVSAPLVAARLASFSRRRYDARAFVFAAICVGLLVSRIPVRLLFTEIDAGASAVAPDAFFSAEAIAHVRREGLKGPVFNSHNLGGYLAWTTYPDVQIFQDSRLQAYPPEHFLSILVASRSQADWNVLVADADWAILSLPRPNQLSGVGMFPEAEWRTVFRDRALEIVVRRQLPTPNAQSPNPGTPK